MDVEATDVASPSRKQIEAAVSSWWQGGGTASRLVDVLARGGATAAEARQVAERLAERVASGKDYTGAPLIEEELERVRAIAMLGAQEQARVRAAQREAWAVAAVWEGIRGDLRAHGADHVIERFEQALGGLGSAVLASQWRALLAEDWTLFTGEENPVWLPRPE